MAESAGKSQISRSKTEKAKVEKNKAERSDILRAASVKGGSSRRNAGIRAESGSKADNTAQGNTTARQGAAAINFAADPTNYVNRKLSWLEFDYRVLSESRDKGILLLEHLEFLSITASNLDEFCMVQIASLRDMIHAKYAKPDIAGLTPQEQLDRISERTHGLVDMQYSTYSRSLVPALRQNGLRIITEHEDMTEEEVVCMDEYFRENVYPVLTSMASDSFRPLLLIRDKTLNIAALLRKKSGEGEELGFATAQVPSTISRTMELPRGIDEDGKEYRVVILLEEIIRRNMPSLFFSYGIVVSHPFRAMRNVGLTIDEEEVMDLLEEIQKRLKKRQWSEVIRLEIGDNMDKRLLKIVRRELSINSQGIFKINGPLDLILLIRMYRLEDSELFKVPRYMPQPVPALMNEDDILANIRKGDILFHHPYQSFDPVVDFVRSAARDPEILVIKQTLYRVSGNSPITAALAEATDNGKQASVLVELKARFDKENNINWAKVLEKAGCHMTHGLVSFRAHSKITPAIRMKEDGTRRYIHLGTGSYNDFTTKFYMDCGILICNPRIGEDATAASNMLFGYSEPLIWNGLSVAPLRLRGRLPRMIHREVERTRAGRPAHIMAKMNSLCDREIITALYEASCAGAKVGIIIRGICCLKVGVPGLSENVSVRSIAGNSLEHSRTFYFFNDANPEVYMDSTDWMPRSLDRRVEILFPARGEILREKVIHALEVELEGNVEAHISQPDGSYKEEDKRGKVPINSQEQLRREAVLTARESTDEESPARSRVFKPVMSSN